MEKPVKKRGGAREGAGRKSINAQKVSVMLTENYIRIAREKGNGNISRGIRTALKIIEKEK
jgi:hypothetical protein